MDMPYATREATIGHSTRPAADIAMKRPIRTFAVYSHQEPAARPRVVIPLLMVLVAAAAAWGWIHFLIR